MLIDLNSKVGNISLYLFQSSKQLANTNLTFYKINMFDRCQVD